MAPIVPLPRRPFDSSERVRQWYENELGWATVPGTPVRLITGLRFDVLDVPAEAGRAALRRLGPRSPVALHGGRMRLLVAAGGAEELPGLLDWLEWGTLVTDITAVGTGGATPAPWPPYARVPPLPGGGAPPGSAAAGEAGPRGAAVWLRPPEPGCAIEASVPALPSVTAPAGAGGVPDLVRLVDTVAGECHRVRLRRASAQPWAFS